MEKYEWEKTGNVSDPFGLLWFDDFLKNVTLDAYCLAHPEAHTRFDAYVQNLDPARQTELKAIAKTMVADGEAALMNGDSVDISRQLNEGALSTLTINDEHWALVA